MKAYDGIFIMRYLADFPLPDDKVQIMLNGSKIMCIKNKDVKIIDSLNFILLRLGKFPDTFQIPELQKGYFPHLFNIVENQNVR